MSLHPWVAGSMPAWKPRRTRPRRGAARARLGVPRVPRTDDRRLCCPRWARSTWPTTCGQARRFSPGTSPRSMPTRSPWRACPGSTSNGPPRGSSRRSIGLGGWPMLEAAQALLVGSTFFLVYLAARSAGARCRTASLLTLGGFLVASPGLGMRPQLLALPLFAALLWVTAGREAHPARFWLAPGPRRRRGEPARQLHVVPAHRRSGVARGPANALAPGPPHTAHHVSDRSGDAREPVRLAAHGPTPTNSRAIR